VIVVGAQLSPGEDGGFNTGAAYVFAKSEDDYVQQAQLRASDGAANHMFGHDVAVAGHVVVVGAPGGDSAYLFTTAGYELDKLQAHDSDGFAWFGRSVAIDEDKTVVVGSDGGEIYIFNAAGQQTGTASGLGDALSVAVDDERVLVAFVPEGLDDASSACVFSTAGDELVPRWVPEDSAPGHKFGKAVALEAEVMVVGAMYDDNAGNEVGSAYIFTL
jgi:hypothetical protein